ncbi:hypothetical protein ACFVVX_20980 [Kitasatospora sp. NPDC058170]|uniref:hypothetical protein n=1 Tax=Kitasatospora sp. NPDC058170 TaxID=3346364 RepID=UPI0036D8CDC7
MRTSVITAFAKNARSLSGRRRLATIAATAVLAGGVQLMTADSSWACGDMRIGGPQPATTGAGVTETAPDVAFASAKSTVTADGTWNEVALKITNKTGTDAHGVRPTFGIHTPGDGASLRTQDVRIQVQENGTWKSVQSIAGCYHTVDAGYEQRQRIDNGSSVTLKFRYSIAATSPKGVNSIELLTDAWSAGAMGNGATDLKTVKLTRTQATTPNTTTPKPAETTKPAAKPSTPAKPAAKPAETAKPAAPKPAADQTTTAAPKPAEAPKATPSAAPATTAPAGTPELAQTGAHTPNGLLAATAAALLALGAGALIAVRRMRPQR